MYASPCGMVAWLASADSTLGPTHQGIIHGLLTPGGMILSKADAPGKELMSEGIAATARGDNNQFPRFNVHTPLICDTSARLGDPLRFMWRSILREQLFGQDYPPMDGMMADTFATLWESFAPHEVSLSPPPSDGGGFEVDGVDRRFLVRPVRAGGRLRPARSDQGLLTRQRQDAAHDLGNLVAALGVCRH